MDTYNKYLQLAQTDPAKAYKGLAKVADQRLVTLEKANSMNYARRWAMREGKNLYGEGFHRFNVTIKPQELIDSRGRAIDIDKVYRARINSMLTFINMQSSTLTGLKSIYSKTADTLNDKYSAVLGFVFTPDNIGSFFESEAYKELEDWGSDTVIDTIATFREKEEEIAKRIAEHSKNHDDFSDFNIGSGITDDPLTKGALNELIRKFDINDTSDLYKAFGVEE